MENTGEKKKRGRKPKIKEPKTPKKRGRKPKNKYGITNDVPITKELGSIILHLPINSDDLKNDFVDKEILKYSPEIKSPKPYDQNMSIQPYSSQISSPYPFSGYHKSDNVPSKEETVEINNEINNEIAIKVVHPELKYQIIFPTIFIKFYKFLVNNIFFLKKYNIIFNFDTFF